MKQFFLGMCVLLTASAANAQAKTKPAAATAKPKAATPAFLKNSLDSFSYALGVNIANNLKLQQIDKVSAVAMQKAMADVFSKKATALTDQQCNAVIQTTLQSSSSKRSVAEKAKGQAFLAANKKRPGVIELPRDRKSVV